jgi:hypothetical protein
MPQYRAFKLAREGHVILVFDATKPKRGSTIFPSIRPRVRRESKSLG